jgi:hypothetical protein
MSDSSPALNTMHTAGFSKKKRSRPLPAHVISDSRAASRSASSSVSGVWPTRKRSCVCVRECVHACAGVRALRECGGGAGGARAWNTLTFVISHEYADLSIMRVPVESRFTITLLWLTYVNSKRPLYRVRLMQAS